MYEPREDSFLLQKTVKKYVLGDVLEIGTGSGILAEQAGKSKNVFSVTAVDIDEKSIKYCKKKYKKIKKIKFLKSDLFENVNDKFDIIIFNPPYLPSEYMESDEKYDQAIFGGKKGYEIIERFLKDAKNYLVKNGFILLLFSSITNKEIVNKIIIKNKFKYVKINKEKLDFEELYVYKIT